MPGGILGSPILSAANVGGGSPLLTGLVSYWKLDESSDGSGAVTRVDSHGSNDLTDNNTTASASGKIGKAADHEADNSEYLSSSAAALQLGDKNRTYAGWFKPESLTVTAAASLLSKHAAAGDREFVLNLDSSGNLIFRVFDSSASLIAGVTWGSTLSAGTFYFVACWHDADNDEIGLSVDAGTPVTAATSGTAPDASGTALFQVGQRGNGTNADPYDGLSDEIGVWDRVLTSSERSALYNSGSGLAYPFS